MTTIRRGALELEITGDVSVTELPLGQQEERRSGDASPGAPVSVDDVAAAFGDQLSVVGALELAGPPVSSDDRRGGADEEAPSSAQLRVEVNIDEQAVVLVEQDGYYSWVTNVKHVETGGRRSQETVITFEIALDADAGSAAGGRRGPLSDVLIKPLKIVVFRFLARLAVGQFVKRLEASIEPRLVSIENADPVAWTQPPELARPPATRARVLLLIHGTFSSTRGGFGSLVGTDQGKSFIDDAVTAYDLVVGFDHRTLSEDPRENASQLLEKLKALNAGGGLVIDVITHSRGALVVRSLVEHVLTPADNIAISKAVMVAGPNAGTLLAQCDNWNKLIDLYTNLVVAGCRIVAFAAPPAATVTEILRGSLESLAILVKAIVREAADEERVPGIAAMVPGGTFLTGFDHDRPARPIDTVFYAISSNYEIALDTPRPLPAKFKQLLADGFVDRLMGKDNDLVVDVASMTLLDPERPGLLHEAYALKDNAETHHCTYFVAPAVLSTMRNWLLGATAGSAVAGLSTSQT